MKGKILLVVGLGVGYVLGARAGRERYDQIASTAKKVWGDPRVQAQVTHAEELVREAGDEVAGYLSDGAKRAVAKVTGSGRSAAKSTPGAAKAATSRRTTTPKK